MRTAHLSVQPCCFPLLHLHIIVIMDDDELVEQLLGLIDPKHQHLLSPADCKRFLRARKGNVSKAADMATAWVEWWNSPTPCTSGDTPRTLLNGIVDRNESVYTRLCPLTHMGQDKEGCPIYWEQSGDISCKFGELANHITLDEMVTRHIRNQELAMCRLHHISLKLGKPVEQQVIVFNMKGLSYSLDTRSLSVFRRILEIDQEYYPERLKRFFVINCPWYFTAIWTVVKPWIDPVTRDKMCIVGSDYLSVLREHIDDSQIPTELGGSHSGYKWNWPYPEESLCTPEHVAQFNAAREQRFSDGGNGSAGDNSLTTMAGN